jgi:hypothetical protein
MSQVLKEYLDRVNELEAIKDTTVQEIEDTINEDAAVTTLELIDQALDAGTIASIDLFYDSPKSTNDTPKIRAILVAFAPEPSVETGNIGETDTIEFT